MKFVIGLFLFSALAQGVTPPPLTNGVGVEDLPGGSVFQIPDSRARYLDELRPRYADWQHELRDLESRPGQWDNGYAVLVQVIADRLQSIRADEWELRHAPANEWKNVAARIEGKFDEMREALDQILAE